MKTVGSVVAAAAMAMVLTGLGTARSHAANFDGDWSVLIETAQGKCGSYRAALQIVRGKMLSARGDYVVSGTVRASGATAVTVINNQGSAIGTGRLRGASGAGKWRSSSGECTGNWSATRR